MGSAVLPGLWAVLDRGRAPAHDVRDRGAQPDDHRAWSRAPGGGNGDRQGRGDGASPRWQLGMGRILPGLRGIPHDERRGARGARAPLRLVRRPAGGDGTAHRAPGPRCQRRGVEHAALGRARRSPVRSGHRGKRRGGGVLRRADDLPCRARDHGVAHRRDVAHRGGLQRAGPIPQRRRLGPPQHGTARPDPRRRGAFDPGDRHPVRGVHPPSARAVAPLPAQLAD